MSVKTFEVNLGVGLNQIFPETIKIVIESSEDEQEKTQEIKKRGRKPKKKKSDESDRTL